MIKKLQQKLSTLLILLLTIIWIGILLLFLNSTYQSNLKDVKEDVRITIRDTKWKKFIRTQGASADLDDIEYCVFELKKNQEPKILFQTFKDKTNDDLITYGQKYNKTWKRTSHTYRYTYIYKFMKKKNKRYLVLISSRLALQDTLPTINFLPVLFPAG